MRRLTSALLGVVLALLCLVTAASAAPMTLTISGTSSGILNGVSFTDKAFQWALDYDTTSYWAPWGETQPIFQLSASTIDLSGVSSPLTVTESHGLFVWSYNDNYMIAPIRMDDHFPGRQYTRYRRIPVLGWQDADSRVTSCKQHRMGSVQ